MNDLSITLSGNEAECYLTYRNKLQDDGYSCLEALVTDVQTHKQTVTELKQEYVDAAALLMELELTVDLTMRTIGPGWDNTSDIGPLSIYPRTARAISYWNDALATIANAQ